MRQTKSGDKRKEIGEKRISNRFAAGLRLTAEPRQHQRIDHGFHDEDYKFPKHELHGKEQRARIVVHHIEPYIQGNLRHKIDSGKQEQQPLFPIAEAPRKGKFQNNRAQNACAKGNEFPSVVITPLCGEGVPGRGNVDSKVTVKGIFFTGGTDTEGFGFREI